MGVDSLENNVYSCEKWDEISEGAWAFFDWK